LQTTADCDSVLVERSCWHPSAHAPCISYGMSDASPCE